MYIAILDLACLMLVKIRQMLIAYISTYQKIEGIKAPSNIFLEGSKGLY